MNDLEHADPSYLERATRLVEEHADLFEPARWRRRAIIDTVTRSAAPRRRRRSRQLALPLAALAHD